MSIEDRLAKWEALAEAATDGPWFAQDPNDEDSDWYDDGESPLVVTADSTPGVYTQIAGDIEQGESSGLADAAFIAASRTVIPALTAALRAVLALIPTENPELIKAGYGVDSQDILTAITAALSESEVLT